MTELAYDILTAWFGALNGAISVSVYKESVLPDEEGDYVLLRIESQSTIQNNTAFMKNPVLVCEAVTKQQNSVNPKTAWDIMNEIGAIIFLTPGTYGISVPGVYNIEEVGTIPVQEEDATPRIYRVIGRYLHQTMN